MGFRVRLRSMLGLQNQTAPTIGSLLPMITRRAEKLDPRQQAETFVSLGGVEQALLNPDSRVVFGRRGTGKTHILSYVADAVRKKGEIALQIDFRTIGSNSYLYTDESTSIAERASILLRDFVRALHDNLLDEITAPKSRFDAGRLAPLVDKLGSAVSEIVVRESFETKIEEQGAAKQSVSSNAGIKGGSLGLSFEASAKANLESSNNSGAERVEKGKFRLSVNIGTAHRTLGDIVLVAGKRIWILLDEWATVPEALQPYLADFIKRSLLPHRMYSVHIAAIEQRSSFRIQSGSDSIGIELGSDVFADLNLDDYLVFENSPERSLLFFRNMLFRHLQTVSEGSMAEKTADEFIKNAFTQEPTFRELVRACEGVPRDAINILQIAAIRAGSDKISIPHIREAAKDWYERDKAAYVNETPDANALLLWISKEVIGSRKARAFLLRSDVKDSVLERLFDERILHIAKRSYSAKEDPGTRYKVWKLDYGCYVDRINTSAAPTGFLFEDQEIADVGFATVPEDDLRAIRRAVLDLDAFKASKRVLEGSAH